MPKPKIDDAGLDAMIDAGTEAVDLYELAKTDILRRADLRKFLKAALKALPGAAERSGDGR